MKETFNFLLLKRIKAFTVDVISRIILHKTRNQVRMVSTRRHLEIVVVNR